MNKKLKPIEKTKKGKRSVVDCRFNGEYQEAKDKGKVLLRIPELNIWLHVANEKISTKAKRAEFIENYKKNLAESRKRFGDLYQNVD